MVGCVLSQLKPSEFFILSCEKRARPSARDGRGATYFPAKNVELLGLYPMRSG